MPEEQFKATQELVYIRAGNGNPRYVDLNNEDFVRDIFNRMLRPRAPKPNATIRELEALVLKYTNIQVVQMERLHNDYLEEQHNNCKKVYCLKDEHCLPL